MAKLEGYNRVAVLKYGCCEYFFAIYDDRYDYHVGDMIVLSGGSTPGKIVEILTVDEATKRIKKPITSEVIGKVDISDYERRVECRDQKAQLKKELDKRKKELDKRKKEIQQQLDDEYYASKDLAYAELLDRYNKL